MDAAMNIKGWYGFVGLGQMGGNEVKSIHAKGYPIMAANTAQSDLDMGVVKKEKRLNSYWQKIIVRILTCLLMRLR